MEFIVTAGAMREEIDGVRSITNHATGALGRQIAMALAARGGARVEKIHYLCDEGAQTPALACAEILHVRGAAQTGEVLTGLLRTRRIAAVVHSMAVSDYAVRAVSTVESLAKALAERLRGASAPPTAAALGSLLCGCLADEAALERQSKYPSNLEHMLLVMQRTPKLIAQVKSVSPQTRLVGFKLLDGVPQAQLIDTAWALLRRNGCDYVLANDLQSVQAGRHTGYLVEPDGSYTQAQGKAAIAALIAEKLFNLLGEGSV